MIGLMLAAAVYSIDPPSTASWAEIARELKATGRVSCALTPQEARLRIAPIILLDTSSPSWGYGRLARHPGCAVLQLQVSGAGRVTHASVVRQKGEMARLYREQLAPELRYAPGRNDRVTFMAIITQVPAGQMDDILEDLDRRADEDAKTSN